MVLKMFSSRPEHPLGDIKALKHLISALPADNAFKFVDDIHGWFESLRPGRRFCGERVVRHRQSLDEAAQPHLQRLNHDYLFSPRLSKSEGAACGRSALTTGARLPVCMRSVPGSGDAVQKEVAPDKSTGYRALALARLVAARACQQKWIAYRYGLIGEDLWRGLALPMWPR